MMYPTHMLAKGYPMSDALKPRPESPGEVTVLEQRGKEWSVFAKPTDAQPYCGPGDRMETLPVHGSPARECGECDQLRGELKEARKSYVKAAGERADHQDAASEYAKELATEKKTVERLRGELKYYEDKCKDVNCDPLIDLRAELEKAKAEESEYNRVLNDVCAERGMRIAALEEANEKLRENVCYCDETSIRNCPKHCCDGDPPTPPSDAPSIPEITPEIAKRLAEESKVIGREFRKRMKERPPSDALERAEMLDVSIAALAETKSNDAARVIILNALTDISAILAHLKGEA
jgi:hypothetical protein